ncbi:MAG TPA: hypothetical protein VKV39_11640 [Candidatus Sulfotelmatobacter sp.]|nr:hypothetical protein [Candidatus Sulfotelmatobacter sp.]
MFALGTALSAAQNPTSSASTGPACKVEPVEYKGWQGQQMSNRWLRLTFVPQNGGRLMQVNFAGHDYLFVNPKLAGKYMPPTQNQWFNYGGDKIWLLPEGNDDEQHWPGNSDLIDDAPATFQKISEGQKCEIMMTGTADPQTGIQITRTVSIEANSTQISFRAKMKNITGHPVEWSMQSVSQYNTADSADTSHANRDFWAYTPANTSSGYLNRYHVRFGPAENPAASVREDGYFTAHYAHLAAELWIDSNAGWIAVLDGATKYAMVERFSYEEGKTYPGKASVIFWMNGPELRLDRDGVPSVSTNPDGSPFYMEAELNSPMCRLRPGDFCEFATDWFPTRSGTEFHGVTDPGLIVRPLTATREANGKIKLAGSFGVLYSGKLVAHIYDGRGAASATMPLSSVRPSEPVVLDTEIEVPGTPGRVSLHLEDDAGLDRGSFQEVPVTAP